MSVLIVHCYSQIILLEIILMLVFSRRHAWRKHQQIVKIYKIITYLVGITYDLEYYVN